eukprot:scaffold3072_cov25-Tisochrysis_lutea.AAC.2
MDEARTVAVDDTDAPLLVDQHVLGRGLPLLLLLGPQRLSSLCAETLPPPQERERAPTPSSRPPDRLSFSPFPHARRSRLPCAPLGPSPPLPSPLSPPSPVALTAPTLVPDCRRRRTLWARANARRRWPQRCAPRCPPSCSGARLTTCCPACPRSWRVSRRALWRALAASMLARIRAAGRAPSCWWAARREAAQSSGRSSRQARARRFQRRAEAAARPTRRRARCALRPAHRSAWCSGRASSCCCRRVRCTCASPWARPQRCCCTGCG